MNQEALIQFSYRYQLTPREMEILQHMIYRGMSNREIADHTVISEKTVKNHISNLYCKCGVSTYRQLISLILSQVPSGALWQGVDLEPLSMTS